MNSEYSEPAAQGGIFADDGLAALGAGGNQTDLDIDGAREEFDVLTRFRWEHVHSCDAFRRSFPAGQCFINRLDEAQVL